MNKIKQQIGYHYPCIIRRRRRGEYIVYFRELPEVKPGGFFYTNITLAAKSHFYAKVYRDMAKPKTWFVVINRDLEGKQVDGKSGFKTMIEAAEYARDYMMVLEGWHDDH